MSDQSPPEGTELDASGEMQPDVVGEPDGEATCRTEPEVEPSIKEVLRQKAAADLRARWVKYDQALPHEMRSWPLACIYVRESGAASLTRDAPGGQLDATLRVLTKEHYYVPWEGVFFDTVSGGSRRGRDALSRMLDAVGRSGFVAVGALKPNRIFRNATEREVVETQFRAAGIPILYATGRRLNVNDPRDWKENRLEAINDEAYIREGGQVIATQLRFLAENGRPIGPLPEGYVITERGPSYLGKLGEILQYGPSEELSDILIEGAQLYINGEYTFEKLAAWSLTQRPSGLTPKGSRMDHRWWQMSLTNPKYAGYHKLPEYLGFDYGKLEGLVRPKRTRDSELVPCMLPPLWTLEDHRAIQAVAAAKQRGPKQRRRYQSCLLSGIAYDADCNHKMYVTASKGDRVKAMVCSKRSASFHPRSNLAMNDAERALDDVIAGMRLDDAEIFRLAEVELKRLWAATQGTTARFQPNPRIAQLRSVVTLMRDDPTSPVSRAAATEVEALEQADVVRRESLATPVLNFQASLEKLRTWGVWTTASTARKNELLRAAGVRVYLRREGKVGVIERITCEHPAFAFALSLALDSARDSNARQVSSHRVPSLLIALEGIFEETRASLRGELGSDLLAA